MSNNRLDVNGNSGLGDIKFPRSQAQADYKISKKEVKRKDGTTFFKKTTTINDEKISDACVQIFQQSELSQQFDYEILRKKAEEDLLPEFKKYGLAESETSTKKNIKDINKKKEIAISQYIRNHIEQNVDLTFEVGFDEFVQMTGIKSATRIGNALKMLDEVQNKATYEYKQPVINEDFTVINYELTKVATIPTITLVLDEEIGEKYDTISEYAKSDVRNKRKHIKGIKFDINKSFLSSVLGLGRDYTSTPRKLRDKFNSSYSFRLDILIRSIEKVQHIPSLNRFTFEEIQKKFGTGFKDYRIFKRKVLMMAIKDLNEFTELNVELIEYRKNSTKNGEVEAISFSISRDSSINGKTKFGIDNTAYYIASRLFYFSKQNIENLLGFAKHVEKSFNSLDLVMYGEKYLAEWKVECDKAIESEKEIIQFMDNHNKIMVNLGLEYDPKRMCVVQTKITNNNEEGFNPQKTISIISTPEFRVENPMTSIIYLHGVVKKEGNSVHNIIDFMPFSIANSTGWVEIDELKKYKKHEDVIKMFILEKKFNYFKFDNEIMEEVFFTNIERQNFSEISEDFRKMVLSLSKDK